MNIGILGGTFSPPHMAHLWVAQQVLEDGWKDIDKVWLMPNTGSDCYGKGTKITATDRLDMCRKMIEDFSSPYIEVSDIEIINGLNYTYQLAEYLQAQYPNDKFYLIIGGDWEITKFKKWEKIVDVFCLITVHRPGFNDKKRGVSDHQDIEFDLNSSIIRERLLNGRTVRGLITPSVERYILEKNLYKAGPNGKI